MRGSPEGVLQRQQDRKSSKNDFRATLTEARMETECLHNLSISINACLLGVVQFGSENASTYVMVRPIKMTILLKCV